MARAKRVKGPIKRRGKKEPPDKQKAPPVEKPKANEDKGPTPKQDLENVKRKREEGVPAPMKRSRMDHDRKSSDKSVSYRDYEESDVPMCGQSSLVEDPNTSQEGAEPTKYRKDIVENESFDEVSSAESDNERPDPIKRKSYEGMSSPKKRFKANKKDDAYDDEDWIPESDNSDSLSDYEKMEEGMTSNDENLSSEEEQRSSNAKRKGQGDVSSPNPEPKRNLRGTRYIKIRRNIWKVLSVPGDGNCEFYTIAKLAGRRPQDHYQLRLEIVHAAAYRFWTELKEEVIAKHFSGQKFQKKTDEELQQLYYNKMTTLGEYATDVEIKIASRILPFCISYIQKYPNPEGKQKEYRVCNYDENSTRPRKWIIFTGENEQGHYEPLEPVGEIEFLENGGYDDASTSQSEQFQKRNSRRKKNEDNLEPKHYVQCAEKGCSLVFEKYNIYLKHLRNDHKKDKKDFSKGGVRFPCPYPNCHVKPTALASLHKHFKSFHFDKPLWCPKPNCNKMFRCKYLLRRHIKTGQHNGSEKWSYTSDPDTPVKCVMEECGMEFTKSALYLHHLLHDHNRQDEDFKKETEGKYPCPYPNCRFVGSTITRRSVHFNLAHFTKPFVCKEQDCNQQFKYKSTFIGHVLSHEQIDSSKKRQKPTKQNKSGTFSHRQSQKRNNPLHSVTCAETECDERFFKATDYLQHLFKKHGKKESDEDKEIGFWYLCPQPGCQKKFEYSEVRLRHFRDKHFNEPLFCKEQNCGKQFARIDHYKKHMKMHEVFGLRKKRLPKAHGYLENKDVFKPLQIPCPKKGCNLSFQTQKGLHTHLTVAHCEIDSYPCLLQEECNKICFSYGELKKHMAYSHGREMKDMTLLPASSDPKKICCPVVDCGKRFWNESDKMRHLEHCHSTSKNYVCQWPNCKKAYKSKSNLTQHVKKHHKYYHEDATNEPEEEVEQEESGKYNGVTKEQLKNHITARLLTKRSLTINKKYSVYFVLGIPNDLLVDDEGKSIHPDRQWLRKQAAKKKMTKLKIYVGACSHGGMSPYHTESGEEVKSSVKNYIKAGKGKCFKIAEINCSTEDEMMVVEAAAQQFIQARYMASVSDSSTRGIVFEPMWSQTSTVFIQKYEMNESKIDDFIDLAITKSQKVFCLDDCCYEPQVDCEMQRHPTVEFPFEGFVHVHKQFERKKLTK